VLTVLLLVAQLLSAAHTGQLVANEHMVHVRSPQIEQQCYLQLTRESLHQLLRSSTTADWEMTFNFRGIKCG
jgi:hypothetical protein